MTVGDVREVQCTVRFRQEAQGVMVDQWCDIVWVRVTQWELGYDGVNRPYLDVPGGL